MMEWTIIIGLLIIGVFLILIEIIFIPGTTVFGIVGFLTFFLSSYIAFNTFGNQVGLVILLISTIILLITVVYTLNSKTWEKLSLQKVNRSKFNKGKIKLLKIGDEGKAISSLKPYGKGVFDGKIYEIKTNGNFVKEQNKIKIIDILQNKIIVEKL